jgi:hypothetical protein
MGNYIRVQLQVKGGVQIKITGSGVAEKWMAQEFLPLELT